MPSSISDILVDGRDKVLKCFQDKSVSQNLQMQPKNDFMKIKGDPFMIEEEITPLPITHCFNV